jgi:GTP-binding protein
VPRGGPDGGDGGDGGSVLITAADGVDSLNTLAHRKLWQAPRGLHGEGNNRHGKNGEDLTILVPPGTLVIDQQHNMVLKDLTQAGDTVIAARGGKGGRGNAQFKSSTHQAPREFTPGRDGEERRLLLELKVIADAGLIGKPNAGKSTLLSRLSKARPEIADYPFTTKAPNLGRVQVDLDHSFLLADIPGLIEGAHEGVGLGHEFLRHIQRAGVLVHLVEPCPMDGSDPITNYRVIRDELVQFDESLATRPEIVVVSKAELPGADDVAENLRASVASTAVGPPLLVSAVTGLGLRELTQQIARWIGRGTSTELPKAVGE